MLPTLSLLKAHDLYFLVWRGKREVVAASRSVAGVPPLLSSQPALCSPPIPSLLFPAGGVVRAVLINGHRPVSTLATSFRERQSLAWLWIWSDWVGSAMVSLGLGVAQDPGRLVGR